MTPYYQDSAVTIYHGDCRDVLDSMPVAGLCFADPPYHVGFKYDGHSDGDMEPVSPGWLIAAMQRRSPVVLVTPGMRRFSDFPRFDWAVCWLKPGSTRRSGLRGFNTWEPVLVYGPPARPVYQDSIYLPDCANHSEVDAPCPKPLRLMKWLISEFSDEGLVIDPFAGSGTTLRAAKDLGRRAIGIEIEERYCEIAARRMAQEVLPLQVQA